jgi:hypothetical protein
VREPQRMSRAVDDAHRAELRDDVSHRPPRRVHVANERDDARSLFVDDDAHVQRSTRASSAGNVAEASAQSRITRWADT